MMFLANSSTYGVSLDKRILVRIVRVDGNIYVPVQLL